VFPFRQVRRERGQGPENARPVGCGEACAGAQTLVQGSCWAVLGSAPRCASIVGSAYDVGPIFAPGRRRALSPPSRTRPRSPGRGLRGADPTGVLPCSSRWPKVRSGVGNTAARQRRRARWRGCPFRHRVRSNPGPDRSGRKRNPKLVPAASAALQARAAYVSVQASLNHDLDPSVGDARIRVDRCPTNLFSRRCSYLDGQGDTGEEAGARCC